MNLKLLLFGGVVPSPHRSRKRHVDAFMTQPESNLADNQAHHVGIRYYYSPHNSWRKGSTEKLLKNQRLAHLTPHWAGGWPAAPKSSLRQTLVCLAWRKVELHFLSEHDRSPTGNMSSTVLFKSPMATVNVQMAEYW